MLHSKIAAVLFAVMLASPLSTVLSQTQFLRTFGTGAYDYAEILIGTSDKGFVILAVSYLYEPDGDILVFKCDELGRVVWATLLGGDALDFPVCGVETADGDLMIGGTTRSFGAGESDIFLVMLNSSGNLQWAKTFGGTEADYLDDLTITLDGRLAMLATTENFGAFGFDMLVCKLNSAAEPNWSVRISTGGTEGEQGAAILQTSDLGFAVLGTASPPPFSDKDIILSKLTLSGNLDWMVRYGGNALEEPYSFVKTVDGGFVVTGKTTSFGIGKADILLMRLAGDGSPIWTRTFGGIEDDIGFGIVQVLSGHVVAGLSCSFDAGAKPDAILMSFDPAWNLQLTWRTGAESVSDKASCVTQTPAGCVTIGTASTYDPDMALTAYDNNGTTCVGQQVIPQETIVSPEVGGLNGAFTFIELTGLMHEPVVKHPVLTEQTVCRALVLCGDADLSGTVDIDDIVYIVTYIFDGGPPPDPAESGDVDCSGGIDIDDVVFLVNFVFSGGNYPCDINGDGNPDC